MGCTPICSGPRASPPKLRLVPPGYPVGREFVLNSHRDPSAAVPQTPSNSSTGHESYGLPGKVQIYLQSETVGRHGDEKGATLR
eukprot:3335098-Rhodomonas_salina.1